jgi:putative methyltransferase
MHSVYFFQVNFTGRFRNTEQYWLPYSVGCLWSYAQQHEDIAKTWQVNGKFYRRDAVDTVLAKVDNPTLCVFSCYIWNEQWNLTVAQAIKQRWPQCQIVFGGPQSGGNHLRYDFIDAIVVGEGEESFVDILHTINRGQPLESLYQKRRLDNLDIPSPYLTGFFDDIIAEAPSTVRFQTVLETNRGCPYQCTFCDWGSATYSKIKRFNLERVEQEVQWIARNPVVHVYMTDANFGAFRERDLEIAHMIERTTRGGSLESLIVNYAKNSSESVFRIAQAFGRLGRGVTLSVQTMNPETLRIIKRDNMETNDLSHMYDLAQHHGVGTYTELILGLPMETVETFCNGVTELLELGQHTQCDVYLANLIEHTELNQVQRQQYGLRTHRVGNFLKFSENDESGIVEYTEFVCATNTMTQQDMTAAYMFHWCVNNFHYVGYSQLLARYCRAVLNVSYRDFYWHLAQQLQQKSGVLGDLYHSVQAAIHRLFDSGEWNQPVSVYDFTSASFGVVYDNIESALELSIQVAKHFGTIDPSVIDLQQRFVYNTQYPPVPNIQSNYDVNTWQQQVTVYEIQCQVDNFQPTAENIWSLRRSNRLKNRLVALEPELEL